MKEYRQQLNTHQWIECIACNYNSTTCLHWSSQKISPIDSPFLSTALLPTLQSLHPPMKMYVVNESLHRVPVLPGACMHCVVWVKKGSDKTESAHANDCILDTFLWPCVDRPKCACVCADCVYIKCNHRSTTCLHENAHKMPRGFTPRCAFLFHYLTPSLPLPPPPRPSIHLPLKM